MRGIILNPVQGSNDKICLGISTWKEFYSDIAVLYPVCPCLKIFLLCLVCQEFFTQMREEIKIQFLVCTSSLLKNQSESAHCQFELTTLLWSNRSEAKKYLYLHCTTSLFVLTLKLIDQRRSAFKTNIKISETCARDYISDNSDITYSGMILVALRDIQKAGWTGLVKVERCWREQVLFNPPRHRLVNSLLIFQTTNSCFGMNLIPLMCAMFLSPSGDLGIGLV